MTDSNVKKKVGSRLVPDSIPARIKALRDRLQLEQTELAQDLGVKPNTISEWESGRYVPSAMALMALGRFDYDNADWWYEQAGPRFAERLKRQRAVQELRAEQRDRAERGEGNFWEPDLLKFVLETIDNELKKRGKKLPSPKYAEMVVLFYEWCQQTRSRDSSMVERLLKIA